MSDRLRRRIAWTLVTASVVGIVAALVLYTAGGRIDHLVSDYILPNAFGGLVTAVIGAVGVRRLPRNGAVWFMVWISVAQSVMILGAGLVVARAGVPTSMLETSLLSPSELDPLAAVGAFFAAWMWIPAVFGLGIHGVLLFPTGTFPSRRWRVVAWVAAAVMLATSMPFILLGHPWSTTPITEIVDQADGPAGLGMSILLVIAVSGLVNLVRRMRRSSGEERLQYRWGVWGFSSIVLMLFFATTPVGPWMGTIAAANLTVSYGVAVLRYRLYGINVVISRAFVYGSLALFIGAVYVAVVVGVGRLIGSGDEANPGLAIAATVLVAVAFQPLRRRLERVANRLVYGRLSTPYEVLSEFSRRVAATDDRLLDEVARSVVEGTGAVRVAVLVRVGEAEVEAAAHPPEAPHGGEVTDFPIEDAGEHLGTLRLVTPRGQRIGEEDRRLAAEVSSGIGLALRNQALTETLQQRVEALQESRRRLVVVQDETRRKLERDLHDGAQQQLVALKVKLGLARAIAQKDGAERTASFVEQLGAEADAAIEAMRDFARGVYPPLLEAEGLGAAITAQARRAAMPVTVEADGIGRYGRDVEATVYFCVLEALQNVAKYADASTVNVFLADGDGTIRFLVVDDGSGFDPANTPRGAGLTNMTDRIEAVAGTLTVRSAPERGTTVSGAIPVGVRV